MINIPRLSDDEINKIFKEAERYSSLNFGIMCREIIITELLMRVLETKR